MKIELSKEQYKKLLTLVYMGNYMINGIRTPEETVTEYQDLSDYMFSLAPEAGLSELVTKENGRTLPSEAFEMDEELNQHIETYDEVTFFDELDMRLKAEEECEEEECCDEGGCAEEECDFDALVDEFDDELEEAKEDALS